MKKTFGVLVVTLVLFLSLAYGLWQISKSRTFQLFGGLTDRIDTNERVVALTFDDAPSMHTGQVLDILAQRHVKATLYEIGSAIEQHPQEALAITRAGMEVGNHSYSHQPFILKPLPFIEDEIQKTNKLIRDTGYSGEITFRPPNGKKLVGLPWYLQQHHILTIMWDVEPDTFEEGGNTSATADFLVKYTWEHTQPGSIILLHPFCDQACQADRDALPQIIDGLSARGYTFVTVSELLTFKNR